VRRGGRDLLDLGGRLEVRLYGRAFVRLERNVRVVLRDRQRGRGLPRPLLRARTEAEPGRGAGRDQPGGADVAASSLFHRCSFLTDPRRGSTFGRGGPFPARRRTAYFP